MKNTTIFTLAAGIGSLILASTASADVTLSTELVHLGNTGGAGGQAADVATYRVYANMDAGWRLDAVYGNVANPLSIHAAGGSSFYQNTFGGNTSLNINPGLLAVFSSLGYDTWVTIGLSDSTANALNVVGADLFNDFVSTSNGSWFVTPDDVQGEEVNGQVLIGQFSVLDGSGSLLDDFSSMVVSLQGKDADGNTWNALGLDGLVVPAPGAFALLGVAGLAARRRRK